MPCPVNSQPMQSDSLKSPPEMARREFTYGVSSGNENGNSFAVVSPYHNSPQFNPEAMINRSRGTSRNNNEQVVSTMQRSEVSRAVYEILRTNLPSPLREETSQAQLALIARAVERKLYQVASSPQIYLNLSSLKMRVSALATAVLIHAESARQNKQGKLGEQSEICNRLSAAARKSLTHCVTVLVSYEKRQMDKFANMRAASNMQNETVEEEVSERPARCHLDQVNEQVMAEERYSGAQSPSAMFASPIPNRSYCFPSLTHPTSDVRMPFKMPFSDNYSEIEKGYSTLANLVQRELH